MQAGSLAVPLRFSRFEDAEVQPTGAGRLFRVLWYSRRFTFHSYLMLRSISHHSTRIPNLDSLPSTAPSALNFPGPMFPRPHGRVYYLPALRASNLNRTEGPAESGRAREPLVRQVRRTARE